MSAYNYVLNKSITLLNVFFGIKLGLKGVVLLKLCISAKNLYSGVIDEKVPDSC